MTDDVITYDDTSILQHISELLSQLYEYYTTDLQNRNLLYDDLNTNYVELSTKIDDLNTNILVLNDNLRSLSSFLVGGFSILFVLVLAYTLFNQLFK